MSQMHPTPLFLGKRPCFSMSSTAQEEEEEEEEEDDDEVDEEAASFSFSCCDLMT